MMGWAPEGGRRGWAWERRLEGYFRVKTREGGKLCKGENSDSSSCRSGAMRPGGQRVKADGIWASQGRKGPHCWVRLRGCSGGATNTGDVSRQESSLGLRLWGHWADQLGMSSSPGERWGGLRVSGWSCIVVAEKWGGQQALRNEYLKRARSHKQVPTAESSTMD